MTSSDESWSQVERLICEQGGDINKAKRMGLFPRGM